MTDEKLEKRADEYVSRTGNNDCTIDAYIAGAKENAVVWHDLLKDPEDLPGKGRVAFSHVVMTNEGFREYCNTFTGEWFAAGTFELVDKPRAWCEMPKFEEE